jgi:hypothetical protein
MTIPARERVHLYARHAAGADLGGWSVERDVRWQDIEPGLAHREPEILAALRGAALIESFHPVNLARLLRLTWDDVDAGVVFSLELYEGFKHFHALRTYLDAVSHQPTITDQELVELRRAAVAVEIGPEELIPRLVDFMLSEHLAYCFFRRLSEKTSEPVLAAMLRLIAADETRHAQSASDLLAKRIAADQAITGQVLDAAAGFHHFGEEVVGVVPIAEAGDERALQTFLRRIERLCKRRLVDHLKAGLAPARNAPDGAYGQG